MRMDLFIQSLIKTQYEAVQAAQTWLSLVLVAFILIWTRQVLTDDYQAWRVMTGRRYSSPPLVSCANTFKNITMGTYLFFQQAILCCHSSKSHDVPFMPEGHVFQRNDLPTETSEVIYQSDDYRCWATIWLNSLLLFTFSLPSRAQCVGNSRKRKIYFSPSDSTISIWGALLLI